MTLAVNIKATIRGLLESVLDLGAAQFPVDLSASAQLVNGTGLGAADSLFQDTRTLGASATESLDLAAGGLLSPFGTVFTVARLKAILVRCPTTNANDVILSRPAANGVPIFEAASDAVRIKPGGWHMQVAPDAAGWVVTAGTADLIGFANAAGGSSVSYDVVLIGASA